MRIRSFGAVFLLSALACLAVVLGGVAALDPYDRGTGLVRHAGTTEKGPRTADVSRGRNPAFNAAIFGNSHAQLLDPARLDAATGLAFVQLTVPGTGPIEQFALLNWFLQHHRASAAALILGVDDQWCTGDPKVPLAHPFPFWLYGGTLDYLGGLFRLDSLTRLPRRLALIAGTTPGQRADGYWNYEIDDKTSRANLHADIDRRARSTIWPAVAHYPFLDRLRRQLQALPSATAVILLIPPFHAEVLSGRSSDEALAERRCTAAVAEVASSRGRTALVDWRVIRPETRDDLNFWDGEHMAMPLAKAVEADIEAALARMPKP